MIEKEKKKKKREKPDVNDCAAKKLAQKSMSRKELRDYLRKREYTDEEIERALDMLAEFGYLDDAVFAGEFLIYDLGRGRSRKKAFYDLKRKGVSQEDIDKGYERYVEENGEPDEHASALSEAKKVLAAAELDPSERIPEKIKGRIARRLFTRGFSQSLIYEVLGELNGGGDFD